MLCRTNLKLTCALLSMKPYPAWVCNAVDEVLHKYQYLNEVSNLGPTVNFDELRGKLIKSIIKHHNRKQSKVRSLQS